MSSPFVGEIRPFGFNFAPRNWALCNGQLIAIQQNTALFSILGTYYGGNGTTNFALPNLQAYTPLGVGQGLGLSDYVQGEILGAANVTLLTSEIPAHGHTLNCGVLTPPNTAQNVASPSSTAFFGLSGPNNTYSDVATPNTTFHPTMIGLTGGSQPHSNQQPYLAVSFCICLSGVFPSRN
jgi:microcystin-dependent protein